MYDSDKPKITLMLKKLIFIPLVSFLFFSCLKETKQEKPFYQINISQLLDIKPETKMLSEFVSDIEYIRPEAKKDAYFQLLGISYIGPEIVILYDKRNPTNLVFKRNGQFIGNLGFRGNGPHEYNGTPEAFVFSDLKEIHLFDKYGKKILRYNFDLELLSTIPLKTVPDAIGIYNNQTYICSYNDDEIKNLGGKNLIVRDPQTFKEIKTLWEDIETEKDENTFLNSSFITLMDTLYFSKPTVDKIDIYKISNDKILKTLEIDIFQRSNQTSNFTPISIVQFGAMSFSNYLRFYLQKGLDIHTAYYNLQTKKISNFTLINDLDNGNNFYPMGNCDGGGYYSDDIPLSQLLDLQEKNKKSNPIKCKFPDKEKWLMETVPNVLEDNSWIMVVK